MTNATYDAPAAGVRAHWHRIAVLFLATALAACAGPVVRQGYEGSVRSEAEVATVSVNLRMGGIGTLPFNGNPQLMLMRLDGREIKGLADVVTLLPGEHVLEFAVFDIVSGVYRTRIGRWTYPIIVSKGHHYTIWASGGTGAEVQFALSSE